MTPAAQCRFQAEWCARLGSPFYARLLERAADDDERNGPVRDLLEPYASEPAQWALPLRMMGALHRLVLEGRAPELTRYYPSAGGSGDAEAAWPVLADTLRDRALELAPLIGRPVQTNDVGRSGSLLGGFLLIAERTGLPLRLLELGSSAGLNLCWDRYRYEWAGGAWGDPGSAVRLRDMFVDAAPRFVPEVSIVERAGCDPNPLDVHAAETRLTLRSYIWADQVERMHLLDAALGIARTMEYHVERASAGGWLESRLAEPVKGAATVVFHSVVWGYMDEAEQQRVTARIEEAGARATSEAPVAWLQMERGGEQAEVRLRTWPGFEERVIAGTSFHRPVVRWSQ